MGVSFSLNSAALILRSNKLLCVSLLTTISSGVNKSNPESG